MSAARILFAPAGWMKKNIEYRGYTNRSFEAVRELLKKISHRDLSLFDQVCKVFKVPNPPSDKMLDHYEQLLGKEKGMLVQKCTLLPCRVVKYEKRRKQHAQDCYSISIIGSRELMKKLDLRNVENRLRTARTANKLDKQDQDDDIPF